VYYKPLGYPEGSYRVGPLARLNIVKSMGMPKADKELAEFKQISAGPVESSFHYHHARLVEAMYGIEKIEQILNDPQILDKHVRATAGVNRLEGAGHNNNAMNRGVLQAARRYVKDGKFSEGALNRVEAVIRTFDPCLSCSTHAFGQMPLAMTLVSADGEVMDQVVR
jgi:NAD-reducing hydrogenase large subunit